MGRIWGLAALVVGIWLMSVYGQSRPAPLGLDAPPTQFSVARADAALGRLLGDQRPHPAGSQESAALRTRLLKELADLGINARTETRMSCSDESRRGFIPCATVSNTCGIQCKCQRTDWRYTKFKCTIFKFNSSWYIVQCISLWQCCWRQCTYWRIN